MAIHAKPKRTLSKEAAAEAFVTGAPDATVKPETSVGYDKGIVKGHKRQVSITISPDLLRKIDAKAEAMGTGRSAFISMAVFKALQE